MMTKKDYIRCADLLIQELKDKNVAGYEFSTIENFLIMAFKVNPNFDRHKFQLYLTNKLKEYYEPARNNI